MGARRVGRERALQALYQLDEHRAAQGSEQSAPASGLGSADPAAAADALEAAWASADEPQRDSASEQFAQELVQGACRHLAEIDAFIEAHSHHWRLERMQRVDRNILRLGVFELVHRPDIPRKVTINEAIELGKKYGNEESAAFINGLLDRIAAAVQKP